MRDRRLRSYTKTRVLYKSKEIILFTEKYEYTLKLIYNDIVVNNTLTQKKRYCANKYYKLYDTHELITFEEDEKID